MSMYNRNHSNVNPCAAVLNSIQATSPKSMDSIASETGLSPLAVDESLRFMSKIGLPLVWTDSNMVRLYREIIPLDIVNIVKKVSKTDGNASGMIALRDTVDSTNEFLLARCSSQTIHKQVCIAEHMSLGRGRQNRKWVTGAFENIMMSVGWQHAGDARKIAGLSLAVSVMVVRVLNRFTPQNYQVKWPNDILWERKKLSGILVEIRESYIVVGIGINCRLSESDRCAIEQPVAAMSDFFDVKRLRSDLVAELIVELYQGLAAFSQEGLTSFRQEWMQLHASQGRRLRLVGDQSCEGIAMGINDDGAMLLRSEGNLVIPVYAGEVVPAAD